MHQADLCDEAACRFCGHCLLWIRRRLYVIVAGGPINLTRLLGMRSQTTSWPLSFNTKKVLLDMATFLRKNIQGTNKCYTTINLGSIRRWSATYQVGFDDNRYYWNGTNWGTIYTQQLSQCEMIASLIAPNIGQESRGYVVGIWRGHTNSIITWNCMYFIAKVDGWLQKYGMIPPTWYIQSSPHTTIHWLQLATSTYEQSTQYNIVYAFDI